MKRGREGNIVIKNRNQPVSDLGRYVPRRVVNEVNVEIQFTLNIVHFIQAWKRVSILQSNGDTRPHLTNPDFSEYDEPTKTQGYSKAYVKPLIKICSISDCFELQPEDRLKPSRNTNSNSQVRPVGEGAGAGIK